MGDVLVTGSAGFIGFNLIKTINKPNKIIGLDNLNNYYDVNLKKERIKNTKIKKFYKIDLTDKKKLEKIFSENKIDTIIHLAAQAGVRYSLLNPTSYINNNIIGTFNLLEIIKNIPIKHFLIASTSSIYGFQNKKKFNENMKCDNPVSLYSATKKSVEILSYNYSYNYNIPITNFRFFTVYGPWGRPDMALFKFIDAISRGEKIDIYNYGKMWRDFTYIDDLTKSINKLIKLAPSEKNRVKNDSLSKDAPYRIINIGNQNSVKLMSFVKEIEKNIKKKAKINFLPMQPGDVPYTLSDSKLLYELTGYKPSTSYKEGIKKFFNWYKKYYLKTSL